MYSDLVVALVAWLLVAVFVPAATHKIRHWQRFKPALSAYRLLPDAAVPVVGAMLAALEVVAAVLLLARPATGLGLAAALLVLYAFAMWANLLRGRRFIDCGCGDEPTAISAATIGRNVLLAGTALFAWRLHAGGIVPLVPQLAGLCLAAIAAVLYHTGDQLLANRSTHQRLWLGM